MRKGPIVFQDEIMTLTTEISEALPQFLVSTSNVHEEVQVVDVEYADKEKLDNVAVEEELGWDNLETDTEDDVNKIYYQSSDNDDSEDDDAVDDEDDNY